MIGGYVPRRRKEINRFDFTHDVNTMAWSKRTDPCMKFRLAIGSYIEEYCNKISLVQLNEELGTYTKLGSFDHPYIPTKILWIPDPKSAYPDLLATTGDYLRIWRVGVGGHYTAKLDVLLNNNRSAEYCAPLTSADWNEVDPTLIGTASIDSTCTIWQLTTGQAVSSTSSTTRGTAKTQLIAHDKDVFDIEFSKLSSGRDIFASASADGSIRMFDLRHMEYSTIVFEEPNRRPLLRLAWNKQDYNYLATFAHNSNEVLILDIRVPSLPVATLRNHTGCVNGIAWAPHSNCHICTVAEDRQALIWDCHQIPRPVEDPILAYNSAGRINSVCWSSTHTDWISICYGNSLELLRV